LLFLLFHIVAPEDIAHSPFSIKCFATVVSNTMHLVYICR